MLKRLPPVLLLAVLSPFVAEFLVADQYFAGPVGFQQIFTLLFFVPLYGFGAITIREAVRRSGRGWPTMLLLALAFGLLEEGLLTQSLFNPNYLDQHLLRDGFIPALGIGAPWTVYVLTLHVVWSIGAPIAIVEGRFGREPWLGTPGRWVSGVLFLLGAVSTFALSYAMGGHFLASVPQLASTVVLIVLLVFAAFALPAARRVHGAQAVPSYVFGLVASSLFQAVQLVSGGLSATVSTLAMLVILALSAVLIARVLPANPLGLGAGAVLTYCWHGLLSAFDHGTAATIEQVILVALTLVFVSYQVRRAAKSPTKSPTPATLP